ncbi:2,5-dichloro-2,5-cyclohexadiene-1,4-diol dehydrogenase [Emticicia aquatica]|uniref:2,5-dichloro-2,5-cyclohexadiene-1,4-diol dehydrogenase n=1 Tax=Emticicia aquatica TaxID=1681835 RepID=A0ABN8EPI3_9BACT|nr:glucose 1-dehydrogenase [Emticicia aquatica]CAH0994816.1 2,5-dichloro-2,5-cyclohexadiene-1,4-diol dehydrogenase [Emticicia aquatica]
MKKFENKVCLVTGASSGIGKATALSFAQAGAKVVVSDVNETQGMQVVNEISDFGGNAIFVKCDISKKDEVENLVKTTVITFGRLDYAVNSAGIAGKLSLPIHEYPEDEWLNQIQVNLIGTYYCVKAQITQMLLQGGGNIVCVASAAGLRGQPQNSPYATSKHGVVGLVKTVAIEYATQNIRINAVCPTAIETPMIMQGRRKLAENPEALEAAKNYQAMKRMGQPQEVADVALWLCSDQSSFITGHAMAVDGGAFA